MCGMDDLMEHRFNVFPCYQSVSSETSQIRDAFFEVYSISLACDEACAKQIVLPFRRKPNKKGI